MKRLLFIFLLMMSCASYAVDTYQLSDPKQQETYETLTKELRCLVCQNQTIADSNAELAGDLRRQVYEMLQQGKSREDIVQFMPSIATATLFYINRPSREKPVCFG